MPACDPVPVLRVGARRSRVVAGLVCGSVVVTALAACSSSTRKTAGPAVRAPSSAVPADPTVALRGAASQLRTASAVSLRLHIGAGIADLAALGEVSGSGHETTSAADERLGEEVLGGDVTVSIAAEDGAPLGRTGPNRHVDVSIVAKGASGASAELRAIGRTSTMYLRADVPRFLRLAQAPAGTLAPVRAFVRTHPAFGFVDDALAGRWLKVDLAPLTALAGQAGASSDDLKRAAFAKVVEAFMRDVAVNRTSSTGGEDQLALTAPLRKLVGDVVAVYATIPQLAAQTKDLDLRKVPDRNVTVDAVVKGGALSQLSFDVFQLFPPKDQKTLAGHHFQILVDVDEHPVTVAAPAASTAVDVMALVRAALSAGLG
jgi:hypothetical protein